MGVVVADEDVEYHRTGQHIDSSRRAGDVAAQKFVALLEARAAVGLVFVRGNVAEGLTEVFLMDAVAVAAVIAFDEQEAHGFVFQNGSLGDRETGFFREACAETFVVHKVGEVGAARLDDVRAGRVFVGDAEAFAVVADRELAHRSGEGEADVIAGGQQGTFGEVVEDGSEFFG